MKAVPLDRQKRNIINRAVYEQLSYVEDVRAISSLVPVKEKTLDNYCLLMRIISTDWKIV